MKAKRQALIREIVEAQSIQTQEELAEALRAARIFGQALAVFLRGQIQAKAS